MIDFKYMTNWCVVTGAPSSGKTSVVDELAHRGHAIQAEVARELIEECLRKGKSLADIRSQPDGLRELQRRILELKLAREMALDTKTLVFMDRGMPDSITYFRLAGLDTMEAEAASHLFRYRAVFIFERLPIKQDGIRTESEGDAAKIDLLLEEDYRALGYDPVRVPVLPIAKRADFILAHLR